MKPGPPPRQPVHPSKHFQYDTAPIDSAFSPLTSISTTIAEARALVLRADSGLPIRRPPASLHNPTRPETPAIHRRSSVYARSGSSQSTSRGSLSFTTMLSPLLTPLSSRPVSVDRWSRATSSSSRGRVDREEGEDEADELPGCSEWEEVRPRTAATGKDSLLVCQEEEAADTEEEQERLEERKEQLDVAEKCDRKEMERSEQPSGTEWTAVSASEQIVPSAKADPETAIAVQPEQEKTESIDQAVAVVWHKPSLSFVETDSRHVSVAVAESDVLQRAEEEQQSSFIQQPSVLPPAAATAATSLPTPAAPSSRQLDETLISLVYLASKLHDDPLSLSDPQLDHLYSLASSCLAHLSAPPAITQLAAAFLPLIPSSTHHLTLHCPLVTAVLSSLFTLSRQAANDGLLCPLLPLLLLPSAVLPSKQTLMCLFSLLVNATMSDEGARLVACSEWMEWLLQRTDDELTQPTHDGQTEAQMEEKRVTVCVEVTAILRNIACAPHAHRLFIAPLAPLLFASRPTPITATLSPRSPPTALDRLCVLLLRFPSHATLALNVLRILSKLSLHAHCRAVLDRQVEAMEAMGAMLHSFHGKLALCVRVCFTLGNLTMTNADSRFVIADAVIATANGTTTDGLSVLLSLLTRTHQRNNKLLALLSASASAPSSAATPSSSKHRLMLRENLDLLVKLIRLIANLAIHHDVGRRLVDDDRAAVLVDVLREANERKESMQRADEAVETAADDVDGEARQSKSSSAEYDKSEELILNAISCMTNLSYYHTTQPSTTIAIDHKAPTFLFHPLSTVLAVLTPHLLSANRDTLTSVLRVVANMSRVVQLRRLLYEAEVDEAVLLLLSHGDGEVVEVCAGVLLNCSVDEQWADEKLASEPTHLLTLLDAADGDDEDEDEADVQVEGSDGVDEQHSEAGIEGTEAAAVSAQKAEDERRKWRLRSLIGKVLCNMRRQQQRLELDEEVIERIESSVNEWTMELSDTAEQQSHETEVGQAGGRAQTKSAAVNEAEMLSVFDTVLTSCSR